MKTLNVIQTLSKIAKVISTIIFVCAIVGLCLCAAAACSLAFGFEGLKLGGVTIESLIPDIAALPKSAHFAMLAQGAIACIAAIVLTRFSIHYFKRELADGTPFTFGGAKELLRLGILGVCVPLAAEILGSILSSILENATAQTLPTDTDSIGSVGIGVALIVMSLLCKHGAELQAAPASSFEEPQADQD